MFRPFLHVRDAQGERHFRWRGGDVSRVEGLTDAVFALALTLIVVTLQVPATYAEMIEVFVQAPAFLFCFAILYWLWTCSFRFHRRYGLEDALTIFLNAVLLFLVLLYVYPLKFVMTTLWNGVLGRGLWLRDAVGAIVLDPETGEGVRPFEGWQGADLMVIYGAGYAAIFLVYTAMTYRAWRWRERLQLDERERLLTRSSLTELLVQAGVAALSAVLSLAGRPDLGGWSYFLIGPVLGLHGWRAGRAVAAVAAAEESARG